EFVREILPSFRRLAVMLNATDPARKPFLEQNQSAGGRLGVEVRSFTLERPEELGPAFSAAVREGMDAVMLMQSLGASRAAELALANRLPAISPVRVFPEAGGLMSYGAVSLELWREGAVYVDKILKGAKPADLPVQQATRFELVINLKAAKQIGLTIPVDLLAQANKVIR